MTQVERASIIHDLKTVGILLKHADEGEFVLTARAAVDSLMKKIAGEEMPGIDVLNRIRESVQRIASSGERTTSIIDIQRDCKLPVMAHSEKIYTARMLMARGYQRKLRFGPDGKGSWFYVKVQAMPGHTPAHIPADGSV